MVDYNRLLQERVDKSFNFILIVTSIIAFIASILLFIADLPKVYAILNFSAGILMMIFSLCANRIRTSFKIIVMIVVTGTIAVASFLGGGFTSAFLTLFILSNVIAVLFLPRNQSVVVSVTSIGLMLSLCFYSIVINPNTRIVDPLVTWGLQIVAYLLFIVVLQISVYSVKNYLIENIEGLKKAVEKSNQLAYYDELTQLPNRYKFKIDIEDQIKNHIKEGYIVFIYLKSLSLINSTLGQDHGDQVLIEMADTFKRIVGETSIVARTGGNEFAIWVAGISEKELHQKFDHIIDALKSQSKVTKKKLEIYAAYSKYECGVVTLDACYQRATLVLTYVKDNGTRELSSYNDALEKSLRRKEMLKGLVEQGLDEGEFELYYQAKFDSRTNKPIGVEALARWNSIELGQIFPDEFIPIIESMNMSVVFGNFVIDQVCKDYAKLQEKYKASITASINISPSHIIDIDIVQSMHEALEKYNIPEYRIIIEITEDIIIDGIEEVKPILKALRAMKLKISLDDFGTGYSSLNYLTQLALDELKIDKSFVDQMAENPGVYILIENIIHLSKQFGLSVVAEGVETEKQKDELLNLGCHIIQGYYYARPEPLDR